MLQKWIDQFIDHILEAVINIITRRRICVIKGFSLSARHAERTGTGRNQIAGYFWMITRAFTSINQSISLISI